MEKGRARIPMAISSGPKMGDIHQISANSIDDVRIQAGKSKPIRIEVRMSGEVGLFQIEEVLLGKISASTVRDYIELFATVADNAPRQYL
jgi:metal-dependent HD superfamily phosphatase/phosphodiesterase